LYQDKETSKKLAVLMTCHNRISHTRETLKSLLRQNQKNISISLFLVDDGSPDETAKLVKQKFPQVNVIIGDGELFWCGGMRLAWQTAAEAYEYYYYLWLNDDSILLKDSLISLFEDYEFARISFGSDGIITGACYDISTKEFSYGGKTDKGPVIPDGKVQQCKYTNGNILLVPKNIFENVGGLSEVFTHAIGDYEYGMRCIKNNFQCWCSRKYIGTCTVNSNRDLYDSEITLIERLKLLYSPRGLNVKEYIQYRKLYWPKTWVFDWLKAHFRAICPKFYKYLKGEK